MTSIADGRKPEIGADQTRDRSEPLPSALVSTLLTIWCEEGGEKWIRTQGTSMLPLIREDDYLQISFNLGSLHRGSIVLFSHNGQLIAHRLLRIRPGSPPQFVTRGDNGWAFDETMTADLVGRVLAIRREKKIIALTSYKWQAIGWLIATATLAIAVPYGALRRVKQRRLGVQTLPGVRWIRRVLQAILTTMLRSLVSSHPRRSVRDGGNRSSIVNHEHETIL